MARGKGSHRCKKKSKKIPKQYEKLFSTDEPSTPSTPPPVVSSSSASSSPRRGANIGRKAVNQSSGVPLVSATEFLRSLQLQGHHVSKKKFVIAEKFDKMSEDTKRAYCVKIREMMMEAYGWTDDDIESLLKEQGLNKAWFGTFFSQLKQPSYVQEFDSPSKTRTSESLSQTTSEEGEELENNVEASKTTATTATDQSQGTTVPESDEEDDHCLTKGCIAPGFKKRISCLDCRKSRCANCLVKFKKGDKVISKIPTIQQVICKDRLHVPLEVALICVFDPASPYNQWILEKEKEAYLLKEEYENLSFDDEDSDEDGDNVKSEDSECENVPEEASEELSNLSDAEGKEEFECSDKANEAKGEWGESECDDPEAEGGAESELMQEEPESSPTSWKSLEERLRAIHEEIIELEKKADTMRGKEEDFVEMDEGFKIKIIQKMAELSKKEGPPSEEDIQCMEEFLREFLPEGTDEPEPDHTVDPNEKSSASESEKVQTREMSDDDYDDSSSQNLDDSDSPGRIIAEMILALEPEMPDFKFCLGCGELLTILFMSWERYENHKVPLHLYFHEVMLGFKKAVNAQNLIFRPHKSSKLYLASKYSKLCHPNNCQEQRTSDGCKIHFFEEDRDYIKLAVGNLHSWLQEGYCRVLNECIKPLFYCLFD